MFGYRNLGFGGGKFVEPAAYDISNSVRFEDGDSAYLSTASAPSGSAGSRRIFTLSAWCKLDSLHTGQQFTFINAGDGNQNNDGNSQIQVRNASVVIYHDGGGSHYHASTAELRDSSAWYHIVAAVDTTQGTEADRGKIYINGDLVTAYDGTIAQNTDFDFNHTNFHSIGRNDEGGGPVYTDGYMAEFHWIDGTQLTPATFGETGDYGEWKPKEVSGVTYGTNGFYLDFKLSATGTGGIGKDQSGNGNDFASSGYAATDQMLDSPTNNFPTWNALDKGNIGTRTFFEGNTILKVVPTNTGVASLGFTNVGVSSGKWYWEFKSVVNGSSFSSTMHSSFRVGVTSEYAAHSADASTSFGLYAGDYVINWINGETYNNDASASYGSQIYFADILQIALDLDNGKIWFGVNGTWIASGNPATGANAAYTDLLSSLPAGDSYIAGVGEWNRDGYVGKNCVNFGQDSSFAGYKTGQNNADDNGIGDFYYAPPTGFLAICTKNMAAPAVTPSANFNTVLYDGTGSSLAITGVGFQPDMVWIKGRSFSDNHFITDAVRGVTKTIFPDLTAAEETQTGALTAFGSDGFTVGSMVEGNTNTETHVAWNWLAGNATLGTGDFTQGTAASTCSRNVLAGFSIVSYTGTGASATFGHGLSKAPEISFYKIRSAAYQWMVYTGNTLSTTTLLLNDSDAGFNSGGTWGDHGASIFTLLSNADVNGSSETYISYHFHSVDGYSRVGSYVGNSNADGTFVYTGFRPAFVIRKNTTQAGHWHIVDNDREGFNGAGSNDVIYANITGVEADANRIDFLSNGFKNRTTDSDVNSSSNTYIYLAFAETPFKYSNAR